MKSGQSPFFDEAASPAERNHAMLTHLLGMMNLLFLPGLGTLASIIAVLLMWQTRRRESPFLDDHSREALNFQLSLLVYLVALIPIAIVTFGIGLLLGGLGYVVLHLVGSLRGVLFARQGRYYRYPMCMRFFKSPDEMHG